MVGGPLSILIHDHAVVLGAESCARRLAHDRPARPGRPGALERQLPIVVVAVALWSPLAALGILPFVLCRARAAMATRTRELLDPRMWAPALAVGIVVAAYLALDAGRIPKGWTVGQGGVGAAAIAMDLSRQAAFFLLEAGFIGFAILAIRRSSETVLALVILALLPLVRFGAANDLVMRASIPSLTVLAIGAALALTTGASDAAAWRKKALLASLLAVGAVKRPFRSSRVPRFCLPGRSTCRRP